MRKKKSNHSNAFYKGEGSVFSWVQTWGRRNMERQKKKAERNTQLRANPSL